MPYRQPKILASLCLLSLLLVSPASGLHPEAQTSLGSCAPRVPDVAALKGGGFVAVWVEDAQIPDSEFFSAVIWGRIFDAEGNPQGPRMRLVPTAEDPFALRVVPSGDGGFLIAFREDVQLRIVHFTLDQTGENDFLLGPWNRPGAPLDAGPDDFLSVVSTSRDNEFQVVRFLPSGTLSSTATLREDGDVSLSGFAAAVLAEGDSVIAYQVFPAPMPPTLPIANETRPLRLQRFSAGGESAGEPRMLADKAAHVALAARPAGGLVVVYLGESDETGAHPLVAEVLDAELETVERIHVAKLRTFPLPAVSVSSDGETFTVAWRQEIQPAPGSPDAPQNRLVVRTFGLDATPRGPSRILGTDLFVEGARLPNRVLHPRLAHLGPDRLAAAWWNQATVAPPVIGGCAISLGAFVRTLDATTTCPEENSLCLQDERFTVRVAWEDPRTGDSGVGTPKPVTDDTGTFWFFEEQNLELMVKVLDARPINGHFWVFFGSLTDVEFELTVTDLATGVERTYTNPPFEMASRADTTAFDGEP